MVTRLQLDRLSSRIEALEGRFAPPQPPPEVWIVDCDRAWPRGASEDDAIPFAELEARPTNRTVFPTRITVRLVHADNGHAAVCCAPGGKCFELHGDAGRPGRVY